MSVQGVPLQVIGRELLVPLRISGTWRCPCPGTAAIVLLPTHGRSVVVRLGANDSVPNLVREVRPSKSGKVPDGPLCWRNRVGSSVAADQRYTVVPESGELPKILTAAVEMGGDTDPAGLVRGMWTARLLLDESGPIVALKRKVASYAELMIWSNPKTGRWTWTINRYGKWYSAEAKTIEKTTDTLADAINDSFGVVQGMVAEACVKRDTGRRLAYDPEWAAAHPRRERQKPRDKVRTLAEKPPRKARAKKAPAPKYGPNRDAVVEAVNAVKATGETPMFTTGTAPAGTIIDRAVAVVKNADGGIVGVFSRLDQAEKALRAAKLREVEGRWTAGRPPSKSTTRAPRSRASSAERSAPKPVEGRTAAGPRELKAAAPKGWTYDRQWLGEGYVWRRADKLIALRLLHVGSAKWQLQVADSDTDDFYFMPGEKPLDDALRYAYLWMEENAGTGMPNTAVLPAKVRTALELRRSPTKPPTKKPAAAGNVPPEQSDTDARLMQAFMAALASA